MTNNPIIDPALAMQQQRSEWTRKLSQAEAETEQARALLGEAALNGPKTLQAAQQRLRAAQLDSETARATLDELDKREPWVKLEKARANVKQKEARIAELEQEIRDFAEELQPHFDAINRLNRTHGTDEAIAARSLNFGRQRDLITRLSMADRSLSAAERMESRAEWALRDAGHEIPVT